LISNDKVGRKIKPLQTVCKSQCQQKKSTVKTASDYSLLTGILIALLPKCPFCILSFTSAITVCSSKGLTTYSPHWTSFISIAFAALTILIVAYNYKGIKTQVALFFILTGSALVIYSELFSGLLQPYYLGSSILLLGVWINGSFIFFYNKFLSIFRFLTRHA